MNPLLKTTTDSSDGNDRIANIDRLRILAMMVGAHTDLRPT